MSLIIRTNGVEVGALQALAGLLDPNSSFRSNDQWFLVQTNSNAERNARDALQAPYRACTVYLPLVLTTILHARQRREVERAFLPRYLFVKDEGQGLPVVRTAPGVSHVVRNAGGVVMVAQRWVDEIRAREKRGEYRDKDGELVTGQFVDLDEDVKAPEVRRFVAGETVRVSEGPFASFTGIFNKWARPDQRAAIVVNIFGRMTPVELEASQFEKT